MEPPSVILLGSKPGSVVALETMLRRGWDIRYVVASKLPNPSWISGPSLAEYAENRNIKVVHRQDQVSPGENADFVISYMYRNLVKQSMLDRARRAALNFHAGPLPEFGGWAFYNVAILENVSDYGCTCHYMDNGFDTGALLKVRKFPIIAARETAFSLERKAQEEMVCLFLEFCELAESGDRLPRQTQDRGRMRYMTREEFEALKEIPAGADEETIDRRARAFWYPPYECAYLKVNGIKMEVVPKIAKEQIAAVLHEDDLAILRRVADQGVDHGC